MRLDLVIVAGPAAGRSIPVVPGKKVRVGRRLPSEHIIDADDYLSAIHFAVSNLGDRCLVEDLGSRNGLFVNGRQVDRVELRPNDTIGAGVSRFVANFTEELAATPNYMSHALGSSTIQTFSSDKPAKDNLHAAITGVFNAEPGNLFCVLDPAQDDAILDLLRQGNARHQILYDGKSADDLANYGPYLVDLASADGLLEILIEKGWGKSWGIFIKTGQQFSELRQHLRQFLVVELAGGKKVFFRFYDPRVMRRMVTSFTSAEAEQFFGPIATFFCECQERSEVLRLEAGFVGVESIVISLGRSSY